MSKKAIRILVGNYALNLEFKKLSDRKVQVKSISEHKVSTEQGDCEYNKFIDKRYIRKLARIVFDMDKNNEDIKVSFSDDVKKFISKYKIEETIKL